MAAKSHFINGKWEAGNGAALASTDPASGERVWEGAAADGGDVDRAITAARDAQRAWMERPLQDRIFVLQHFVEQVTARRADLAEAISRETGKPRWEALAEVDSMIGKIPVSIDAHNQRRRPVEQPVGGGVAATRFKPFGVLAVFGPFNFPGHLPNGHIVPALLEGNAIVFKPSELTPLVAQRTIELWEAAEIPAGVINLVQGGRETGAALAAHPAIDGLLFTGSASVGTALARLLAAHPEKILALEMGGNNPLIVHEAGDLDAAAYLTIQSAFITAGQRCTCARRLIVPDGSAGDAFVERLALLTGQIKIGAYTDEPEPFMGPLITAAAAQRVLEAQEKLKQQGGRPILQMSQFGKSPAMLSCGIMNVTPIENRCDDEIFGPFLQVIRVPDFEAALAEANRTAYGLAAGLLSDNPRLYEQFFATVRAGVVTWNRQTTGASGALPFGGTKLSGNNRPSGFWAVDYCSYPVASLENPKLALPAQATPGIAISG